jgi:hypothetical protein
LAIDIQACRIEADAALRLREASDRAEGERDAEDLGVVAVDLILEPEIADLGSGRGTHSSQCACRSAEGRDETRPPAVIVRRYSPPLIRRAQIRTQYLLLLEQSQLLPVNMVDRYKSLASAWLPFTAPNAYGTTAPWILTANTGSGAADAYALATQPLLDYGGVLGRLSADEAARVRTRYDRLELADGSIAHALEALGYLRGHETSMETTVRNLEEDSYATDAERNTQIAVLNKINAVGVTEARLAKDTNNVLVSLLEQQLLEATERREAAAEGINAHIAFLNQAPELLVQSTAQTTAALTSFRIP